MPRTDDISGYTFRAETLCPECTVQLTRNLPGRRYAGPVVFVEQYLDDLALICGIDRYDEHSFDSDEFPKVVFRGHLVHGERCGRCHRHLKS